MTPRYIFIHHTAVSYTKNPDQWRATDAYHKSKGWGGGGYNYEVSAAGSIHQFRADGAVTAAQYQNNMNDGRALSICLDGNFDIELPTNAQKAAVKAWLTEKMQKYNIAPANVLCHRQVAGYKSCPGRLLPDNIFYYFSPMPDDQNIPSPWAKPAWDWAKDNGLFASTPPKVQVSAEQCAVIMKRMYDLILTNYGPP